MMDPLYKPQGVEERWQRTWEAEGLYDAEAADPPPRFVVAHPPPNVTGELHTGHALQISLADALVRYHRMRGYSTYVSASSISTCVNSRSDSVVSWCGHQLMIRFAR